MPSLALFLSVALMLNNQSIRKLPFQLSLHQTSKKSPYSFSHIFSHYQQIFPQKNAAIPLSKHLQAHHNCRPSIYSFLTQLSVPSSPSRFTETVPSKLIFIISKIYSNHAHFSTHLAQARPHQESRRTHCLSAHQEHQYEVSAGEDS